MFGRLGRISEAIEDYSTLIGLRPKEARLNYHRGQHYDELGMDMEAQQDFDRALELGWDLESKLGGVPEEQWRIFIEGSEEEWARLGGKLRTL